MGRAPELGRAKKAAKATTETEAKHPKVKVSRAKHGSGTEVKADSEPPSKARRGAASAKAGSAEKRQEKSRRRSSSVESSAVGLKQARANAKVRRFGGATPTKAAAATAVIGIFAALGVAATVARRPFGPEERQPPSRTLKTNAAPSPHTSYILAKVRYYTLKGPVIRIRP